MTWLLIAIVGYLLNAIVLLVDKFLLTTKIKNPWVYAFYASALGGLALLLWPFDFAFLSFFTTVAAVFSGVTFFFAILYLYRAMLAGEASRVVSIIGGISPIVILALSYVFLGERLPAFWYVALVCLVSGAALLSLKDEGKRGEVDFHLGSKFPLLSLIAAVFFALSFFLSKVVYINSSFLNGFIWMRVGTLILPVILFSLASFRKKVLRKSLSVSSKVPFVFLSNKALSAVGFMVLSYAISLGSVTVVNALQGVQYAFIFVLALVMSLYKPKYLSESFSFGELVQKILGTLLVSGGVALLFLV